MKLSLFLVTFSCFVPSLFGLQAQQPKAPHAQKKASTPQAAQPAAEKTAGPALRNSYDGTWNGRTSQSKTLRFTVEKGRIKNFFAEGHVAGEGCSSDSNTTAEVDEPIGGNTISVSIHAGPGGLSFQVNGSFASASLAQGSARMQLHPVPGPPGTPSCGGFARITWAAWKGDKPPDEATLAKLTGEPKRSGPSLVKLLSPAPGEVMDNGCMNFKKPSVWQFRWSEVPHAQRYHLYVIHEFARNPVLDKSDIRDTSFTTTDKGFIPSQNLHGWKWKVRPMVAGVWKGWSDEQTLSVEPPNKDCDEWHSQFLEAAGKGDAARLKELISLEWAETTAYSSALVTAAKEGQAEAAKVLIAAGANVNAHGVLPGATPLGVAAREGHTEVVQVLLGAGADPNAGEEARQGYAPLIAAVVNGHTEVVRALLGAGADVRVSMSMGGTALEIAEQKRNAEILRLLQEAIKRRD
jgi:hypothetical protein